MNKKALLISLTAFSVLPLFLASVVSKDISPLKAMLNPNSGFQIVFNSSTNKVCYSSDYSSSNSYSVTTQNGNNISTGYSGMKAQSSAWGNFDNNGYFCLTQKINGLKSISITTDEDSNDVTIVYGWDSLNWDNHLQKRFLNTRTIEYDFESDYPSRFGFKNNSSDPLTIVNMTVEYTCEESENSSELFSFALINDGTEYSLTNYLVTSSTVVSQLTIPSTYRGKPVTEIGSSAFFTCNTVEKFIFPNTIRKINDEAFYGAKFTSLTLPSSVQIIGRLAFGYCTKYTGTLIFPESLVEIGYRAFYRNEQLRSLSLPDSLRRVGQEAFYYCDQMGSVVLPETVEVVESDAFTHLTSTSSYLYCRAEYKPEGYADKIANNVLYGYIANTTTTVDYITYNLVKHNGEESWVASKQTKSGLETITIPSEIEGKPVVGINDNAKLNATTITLPEGLEFLGYYSLNYGNGVTYLELPSTLKIIGSNAIKYYNSSTPLIVPESVLRIGSAGITSSCSTIFCKADSKPIGWAIDWCSATAIWSYVISRSTAEFDYYITSTNNESIVSITRIKETNAVIPSQIENITNIHIVSYGTAAIVSLHLSENVSYVDPLLSQKASLETITIDSNNPIYKVESNYVIEKETNILVTGIASGNIPNGVVGVGEKAFYFSSNIGFTSVPSSISYVGDYAFSGANIQSLEFESSNVEFGESVFWYCKSLVSIVLPPNNGISSKMFQQCSSLTDVTFGGNEPSVGSYAFNGCSKLRKLILPDSITYLGESAFESCSFDYLVLPNELLIIDEYCFRNTYLSNLILPNKLKEIRRGAFYGAHNFDKVIFPASVESIGQSAFYNCWTTTIQDMSFWFLNPNISIHYNAFHAGSYNYKMRIFYTSEKAPDLSTDASQYKYSITSTNCRYISLDKSSLVYGTITNLSGFKWEDGESFTFGISAFDNITITDVKVNGVSVMDTYDLTEGLYTGVVSGNTIISIEGY